MCCSSEDVLTGLSLLEPIRRISCSVAPSTTYRLSVAARQRYLLFFFKAGQYRVPRGVNLSLSHQPQHLSDLCVFFPALQNPFIQISYSPFSAFSFSNLLNSLILLLSSFLFLTSNSSIFLSSMIFFCIRLAR
jgi:hypothetical protein